MSANTIFPFTFPTHWSTIKITKSSNQTVFISILKLFCQKLLHILCKQNFVHILTESEEKLLFA